MQIAISLLEKYCDKYGRSIHVTVNTTEEENVLRFVAGKYEQYGSTAIYLRVKDLESILRINNIIGEGSPVKQLIDSHDLDVDKKIDDLIYITLSKYITQMLNASLGKIFYPEIIPLEIHKEVYFKNVR